MKRFRRGEKGFTLVEIAIVLVIVGLVLFGVLKGADMVRAGKAKKTAKQLEQMQAGVFAYADKYRGKYPGEANGATVAGGVDAVLSDMVAAGLIGSATPNNGYGGPVEGHLLAGPPVQVQFISKGIPDVTAATAIADTLGLDVTAAWSSTDLNFYVYVNK